MSKKLLVVDDSVFIYEEMRYFLADTDFEIISHTKTAEDAILALENLEVDIVTMDIVLPGMDGMEAAGIIQKKWPQLKLLIVSSLAYDETVREAKAVGVNHCLFKPFEKDNLVSKLEEVFLEKNT